jgi:sensor c-di-GMP phosphodiesterase-like protein
VLATSFRRQKVAEGIEHDWRCDTLLNPGCKTGQGNSFGKAMPVDEVLDAAVTRRRVVLADNVPGQVGFSTAGRFRRLAEKS